MSKKRPPDGVLTNGKRAKTQTTSAQSPSGLSKSPQTKQANTDVIDLCDSSDEGLAPVASSSRIKSEHIGSPKVKQEQNQEAKNVHPFFQKPIKHESKDNATPPSSPKAKGKQKAGPDPSTTFGAVVNSQSAVLVDYPLDKDIFRFDPAADINTASWPRDHKTGGVVIPYAFLTAAFVMVSATRSRLLIVTILTNTLRTIVTHQPEVLLQAVYLITNHVAPAYDGVELGVGSQVLSKSLKEVSGAGAKQLRTLWNQWGDMGDVAFECKQSVRTLIPTSPLTIAGVYSNLLKICALKGNGVTAQKSGLVSKMLVSAKGEEVRFLVRTLVAHLRIGAVRLTVTAALARCFCLSGRVSARYGFGLAECEGVTAVAKSVKEGKDDPKRKALMDRLAAAEALVRKVYVRHPNYDDIIPALLNVGLDSLEEAIPLSVGTPLSPMLGQITRNLDDVQSRLQPGTEFAAEFKYDGQRVQIHARYRKEGEKPEITSSLHGKGKGGRWIGDNHEIFVRLFSRHLEDQTDKYPDILALIPYMVSRRKGDCDDTYVESFVMDAEIVAIDPDTGALQNFQVLSNRARKDVQIGDVKVRAKVFAFDLMLLNGESLLTHTFRKRRETLHRFFPPQNPAEITIARFGHVASILGTSDDLTEVHAFMLEALSNKCEGLMIKILDNEIINIIKAEDITEEEQNVTAEEDQLWSEGSETEDVKPVVHTETSPTKKAASPSKSRRKLLLSSYEPDKRADSWMKVKKDYAETGGDNLDLVPIAAWHGQGRKVGWWSPLLLAVYDKENDTFQAVCKCISGFTDQFYKDLNERYPKDSETCSRIPFVRCETGISPSWYFKPSEVWEVRGADITLSPVYPAAKGLIPNSDRGLSLRFPRFMKLREDKSIQEATTPEEFAAAYARQQAGVSDKAGNTDPAASKAINYAEWNSDEEEEEQVASETEMFDIL